MRFLLQHAERTDYPKTTNVAQLARLGRQRESVTNDGNRFCRKSVQRKYLRHRKIILWRIIAEDHAKIVVSSILILSKVHFFNVLRITYYVHIHDPCIRIHKTPTLIFYRTAMATYYLTNQLFCTRWSTVWCKMLKSSISSNLTLPPYSELF